MKWYAARIQRAIDWIEANLAGEIRVADVATRAGYSAYHFHRIFTAMVGQPVMEYVRMRRLTEAAAHLRGTGRPILDLALECRFDSQEAFTRAFKRAFGVTPGRYRSQTPAQPIRGRPPITPDLLAHLLGGITMEPRFVEIEPIHVVGMGSWFTPETTREIPALWERFVPRMGALKTVDEQVSYGVCSGEQDSFFYMAALPVANLDDIPHDMAGKTLRGGRFAVFTHKGPISGITKTVDYIWGTWLPRSGEEPDKERNDFELYDERFDPQTMTGEVDIYVPLA